MDLLLAKTPVYVLHAPNFPAFRRRIDATGDTAAGSRLHLLFDDGFVLLQHLPDVGEELFVAFPAEWFLRGECQLLLLADLESFLLAIKDSFCTSS